MLSATSRTELLAYGAVRSGDLKTKSGRYWARQWNGILPTQKMRCRKTQAGKKKGN